MNSFCNSKGSNSRHINARIIATFSPNTLALIQAHLVSDHRYKLRIRGFSPQVMDGVTKIAVQGENIVYSLIIAHRKSIYPINNHFTIVKKKAINFGEIILYL